MNKKKQIEIEDLILEILYENRDLNFTHDGLITKARKKIRDEDFEDDDFTNAIMKLLKEKFIGSRESVIPLPRGVSSEDWTGEQEIIEFYYLAEKGSVRFIDNNLKKKGIKLSEQEEFIKNLAGKVDSQSRDVEITKKEISNIKKVIDGKFSEVKKIRNEVDGIRKEFYGRILLIFSIFVSVFAFIIVGFEQITTLVNPGNDWITNFSNVSVVFFPLLIVLLILMIVTFFIVKATSK